MTKLDIEVYAASTLYRELRDSYDKAPNTAFYILLNNRMNINFREINRSIENVVYQGIRAL